MNTHRTRLVALLAVLIAGLSAFGVSAQRGEKTLGVGGGYATYGNNGLARVYFQYSFAEHVRISPDVEFMFPSDRVSGLATSADMHFPFRVARGVALYPLAGVTFNSWKHSGEHTMNRVGANVGGGLDLYFTQNLKMSVEGKFSWLNDCCGAFFSLGLGYVF